MKKIYTLLFALITNASSFSQNNFYDKCYKVPLPINTWKSIGNSDSALYVVGTGGSCFISYHNGGIKCIYTGTPNNLTGVSFLNNSVGFVWGDQGTLLKTSDGGNSWASIATNTTNTFDKLQVIDENNIFYLAGTTLMKTQNGGVLWSQITLPVTAPITAFHFFTPQNGQISCGQISPSYLGYVYETIDGGSSWNQLNSMNFDFTKLYYLSDSEGYLYGYGPPSLYKTKDKGASWTLYTQSSLWGILSDIVTYQNAPAWIETNAGPQPWMLDVDIAGGGGRANSAFDIHSFFYKGNELLYVLSDSGLYRYMTGGPVFQGLTFFSGVSPNTSNPSNSLLPGKKVQFKVSVKNNLPTNLLTLSGKIRCESPYIQITDSIGTYNNVLTNTTKWSADEFEMQLAADIPDNYFPTLELVLEDQIQTGDPWNSMFSFPIVFTPFAVSYNIIDDDNIPDSNGDNDDVAEPGETIEIIPLADKISQHIFGNMEGYLFSPLNEIKIWGDTMGSTGTVYNHYPYEIIDTLTQPSEDFVFTNNFTTTYNLLFSMVFTGNIKLFKAEGNFNGYVEVDSTVQYRWSTDFAMNSGFPNPPNSIREPEGICRFEIYPNPTFGKIQITDCSHSLKGIKIYNIIGEKIYDSNINSSEPTLIDMEAQPAGIFFITLISDRNNDWKKLLKQ